MESDRKLKESESYIIISKPLMEFRKVPHWTQMVVRKTIGSESNLKPTRKNCNSLNYAAIISAMLDTTLNDDAVQVRP